MNNIRVRSGNRLLPWLMLSVSLAGFSLFYLFPFAASFFYTVVDAPVRGAFCGLQNYRELFQNQYFMRGLKNTVTFMAIGIPLNIALSLGLACILHHRRRYPKYISLIFLTPLAVPSAACGIFLGVVLLLTFFSKSLYHYRLPVVSVLLPKPGRLSFTVEKNAEISYANVTSVYADRDGRVNEILVQAGDELRTGQPVMRFESIETGELTDVIAKEGGIITSIGVEQGMYVSFMQNVILYRLAEKSEHWSIELPLTEEQLAHVAEDSEAVVKVTGVQESFAGKIESIVPQDEQAKTGYLANMIIDSGDTELAGRRVEVTIRRNSQPYDTLLPAAALHKDAEGYYVLVLKEDDSVLGKGYTASKRSVDILDSDKTYCAVRGLAADERIIVSADGEVADGSRVYYEGAY